MNRTAKAALTVAPLLLLSTAAFAAGAEHHVETFAEVGWKIAYHAVNFTILAGVLYYATRGAISRSLANRANLVREDIEASQKLREDAKARFDALQAQLDGLGARINAMEDNATVAAEAEARALEERAARDVELIQEHAERTIRNETERARMSLRREAATLAVDLATQQLRARVGAVENDQLTQQFITAVENDDASTSEVTHG
ncbi:MAG: hypothetical protein AAFV53_10560 [Myxococcota bacterium]